MYISSSKSGLLWPPGLKGAEKSILKNSVYVVTYLWFLI